MPPRQRLRPEHAPAVLLETSGFVLVGPADPASPGGRAGSWYDRETGRA